MKKLNRNPKFKSEKMMEKSGSSITKRMMHVNIAMERYSSRVFFIPLIFKSFFKSEKNSK
jgi:hypothetical protein